MREHVTRISARLKCVQGPARAVHKAPAWPCLQQLRLPHGQLLRREVFGADPPHEASARPRGLGLGWQRHGAETQGTYQKGRVFVL